MTSLASQRHAPSFNKHMADIKPLVARLQHRADRQHCINWMRKLTRQPAAGAHQRQQRTKYARLMLLMLQQGAAGGRRKLLDEPFTDVVDATDDTPLPPLPAYVSLLLKDGDDAAAVGDDDAKYNDYDDDVGMDEWLLNGGESSPSLFPRCGTSTAMRSFSSVDDIGECFRRFLVIFN